MSASREFSIAFKGFQIGGLYTDSTAGSQRVSKVYMLVFLPHALVNGSRDHLAQVGLNNNGAYDDGQ